MLSTFRTSTEHIQYFLSGRRLFRDLPAPRLSCQAPQSLEEFLEQYLSDDLLDSIHQSKLADIMKLLHRLENSLAETMRKKGMATVPLPSIETVEIEAIRDALDYYRGNVTRAAKALGIGRNTLYRKMKEYETKEADGRTNKVDLGRE